jgi:hypothetical protein
LRRVLRDPFIFDEPGVWMDVATGTLYETRQDAQEAAKAGSVVGRDIIGGAREVLLRIRDGLPPKPTP